MVVVCVALAGILLGMAYWLGTRSGRAVEAVDKADVRRCIDWTTQAPTASELYGGCGEPGDILEGFAVTNCVRGPELFAGDVGWGYVGETMRIGRVTEKIRATCEGWVGSL